MNFVAFLRIHGKRCLIRTRDYFFNSGVANPVRFRPFYWILTKRPDPDPTLQLV